MPALTVAEIAELCAGEAEGDPARLITGANSLEEASASDLSFVANKKAAEAAVSSAAGCLLVPPLFQAAGPWSLIRTSEPRVAFARAINALYPARRPHAFVHPTAVIAPSALIAGDCFIGPYATIGAETEIRGGCSIGSACSIGERVKIGEQTILHSHITLYDGVQIGARVVLHSGCVIGADGFGFTLADGHYEKFPQIGTVIIEDDVEIGANSCVDRAALGATRIRTGTKLDNLVHVGHNCDLGRHIVVAAQTGFSGSVTVGDYAVIGGQAGIGERAKIESKAVVGGKSGILTSQTVHAGEPVWGIPARPLRQHLKGLAHVSRLPALREEIRELRRKMASSGAQLKQIS